MKDPSLGPGLGYMVFRVSFNQCLLNNYYVLGCLASSIVDVPKG